MVDPTIRIDTTSMHGKDIAITPWLIMNGALVFAVGYSCLAIDQRLGMLSAEYYRPDTRKRRVLVYIAPVVGIPSGDPVSLMLIYSTIPGRF